MEHEGYDLFQLTEGHREISYDFVKTFFVTFRWVLNALFIGVPWLITGYTGIMWNVILNTVMNRGWAGGNFWLMGNTVFAILQTIHTTFVILEWPFYLRHTFAYRWLMTLLSLIYTL